MLGTSMLEDGYSGSNTLHNVSSHVTFELFQTSKLTLFNEENPHVT